MYNYWPLSEFHFNLSGKDLNTVSNVSALLSNTADYLRKSVLNNANVVMSTRLSPGFDISFQVVSGQCAIGIYNYATRKISLQADIEDIDDIDAFKHGIYNLRNDIQPMLQNLKLGNDVHVNTLIVSAWHEINLTLGFKTDINQLNQFDSKGYTTKDVLPMQKDLLQSYNMYYDNSLRLDSIEGRLEQIRQNDLLNNLYQHVNRLSQHIEPTKQKIMKNQAYIK